MSKKVLFYFILDLFGALLVYLLRMGLCSFIRYISDSWLRLVLFLTVDVVTIAIWSFILFFFLLYWWSDKQWEKIKRRFRRR